ncbi:MAG: hypothetical protein ACRDWY_15810 [Actinomycetes bacterium]
MELLILFVLIGAGIAFLVTRSQRREKHRELESLQSVKSVAEEDVTRLGEDVALLDTDTAGRQLDEATRQDYRRALDSYDAAKAALDRVRTPDDIRGITGILEDGRYAVACVLARLDGRPVPARRPPCFFNPQHGPSTDDVDWAPPGGAPRPVPACPADAERVRAGAEPDVRKVPVGAGRQPYWQGGPGYGPYAQGYFSPFAGSGLLPGVLLGAVMFGGFGGWDGDGSDGGDSGGGGGDSGGGDGGDSGGGDGGGDFGGGDFGGGGFDGGGFDGF